MIQTSSFAGAFNKSSRSPLPKLERTAVSKLSMIPHNQVVASLLFFSGRYKSKLRASACQHQPPAEYGRRHGCLSRSYPLFFFFFLPQFSWQEGLPFFLVFFFDFREVCFSLGPSMEGEIKIAWSMVIQRKANGVMVTNTPVLVSHFNLSLVSIRDERLRLTKFLK